MSYDLPLTTTFFHSQDPSLDAAPRLTALEPKLQQPPRSSRKTKPRPTKRAKVANACTSQSQSATEPLCCTVNPFAFLCQQTNAETIGLECKLNRVAFRTGHRDLYIIAAFLPSLNCNPLQLWVPHLRHVSLHQYKMDTSWSTLIIAPPFVRFCAAHPKMSIKLYWESIDFSTNGAKGLHTSMIWACQIHETLAGKLIDVEMPSSIHHGMRGGRTYTLGQPFLADLPGNLSMWPSSKRMGIAEADDDMYWLRRKRFFAWMWPGFEDGWIRQVRRWY